MTETKPTPTPKSTPPAPKPTTNGEKTKTSNTSSKKPVPKSYIGELVQETLGDELNQKPPLIDESQNIDVDITKKVFKDTGKKISSGAKIAGGAVLGAGAAVGGAALSGLRNAGRAIGGSGENSSSSKSSETGLILLFLVAIVAHLYDMLTNFSRPLPMLYIYVGIIIFAFFFLFSMHLGGSDEVAFIAVILTAYLLPYVPKLFENTSVGLVISGVIGWFPILPLYLGLKFPDNNLINKLTKIYIVFWIIVFAFFVIQTYANVGGNQAKITNMGSGMRLVATGAENTYTKAKDSFSESIAKAIAFATGQPYEGNQESQVGIEFTDIKPLESKYTTESNVYIEAKLKATNVKEPVTVNIACFIDGKKQGTANPSKVTDVVGEYSNIVECNLGQLEQGEYTVKFEGTFEFESTSDIKYTFVSTSISSDQFERLKINPATIATYTGGPVAVGLPSLDQPLRINPLRPASTVYPYGVSLENKWTGQIVHGLGYTLNTPEEIKLVGCTRNGTKLEPNLTSHRNQYTFSADDQRAQDTFDAVSCKMDMTEETFKTLLNGNLKSEETFAARALYEYKIEGETPLVIEKN